MPQTRYAIICRPAAGAWNLSRSTASIFSQPTRRRRVNTLFGRGGGGQPGFEVVPSGTRRSERHPRADQGLERPPPEAPPRRREHSDDWVALFAARQEATATSCLREPWRERPHLYTRAASQRPARGSFTPRLALASSQRNRTIARPGLCEIRRGSAPASFAKHRRIRGGDAGVYEWIAPRPAAPITLTTVALCSAPSMLSANAPTARSRGCRH